MAPAPLSPIRVTVRTSAHDHREWKVEVTVLPTTTVLQIREILDRHPLKLQLQPAHVALRRTWPAQALEALDDNERVPEELVLKDYVPQVGGGPPAPPPKHAPPEPERLLTDEEKGALWHHLEAETVSHSALPPGERRWRSWGRTVAGCIGYMQILKNARRGTEKHPFVVWVLGAQEEVEVHLAETGFLSDANFLDRQPCDIYLMATSIKRAFISGPEEPREGEPPRVRSVLWADAKQFDLPKPDLNVIFNEAKEVTDYVYSAPKDELLSFAACLGDRTLVTIRQRVPEAFSEEIRNRLGEACLRNSFSALAGSDTAEYDDNGWSMFFTSFETVASFGAELARRRAERTRPEEREEKASATFWGIVDIKYDPSKPLDERVKVLETGDGRSSRFSHAGADIPKRFRQKYRLDDGASAGKHAVVSANKKLTHDLMELYGYGHLVPRQVCCPRVYDPGLAARIIEGLGVGNEELVVLKLCNRSRAAGVLPVPAGGLDHVLKEVLQPPPDFEAWMRRQLAAGTAATLKVDWGCYEEQLRHWWSNECPHFVAEQFASSMLTVKDGLEYDGTMRISFVLSRRRGGSGGSPKTNYSNPLVEPCPPANELAVEWIGGYWKLPKEDVESNNIRASVISAARTAGTDYVAAPHLLEVYAAMGDSIQQLFGGSEPSPRMLSDSYSDQPELATYLTARLAIAMRDLSRVRMALKLASSVVLKAPEGPARCSAESFLNRGYGILEALTPPYKWSDARDFFRRSVELLPTNAAALYLLGMSELELGNAKEAASIMERSLVLDLDFKAPYVNLGVAYLRLGRFDEAIEMSEALLKRHPESPQCHYHIGVACYQKAHRLEAYAASARGEGRVQELADLKLRALAELAEARECEEGQRLAYRGLRGGPGRSNSPWLDADEEMMAGLKRGRTSSGAIGRLPSVVLPEDIGWRFYGWRN